jgi:single-strand DNA-binding protein
MNNLNSLILEGVVVGEPHKVEASEVLSFSVGVERYYKNRAGEDVTETSQFKVIAFGAMSKLPLKDGMGVRLVGRLKQNKWTDSDGVSHSEVQVVAEHIEVRKSK